MAEKWTEDDDIYLEYFAYDGDAPIKDAAEFLNRTKAATVYRLVNLRRKNKDVPYIKKKWTQKEDEFLKNNYLVMNNLQLAERLNRTPAAVSLRKSMLGLKTIKPIAAHRARIIEMARLGYYQPEIAKELNINVDSLRKFLIDNEIDCDPVPYDLRKKKFKNHSL